MYLQNDWRILTVGDGDLSFSWSLWRHHQPAHLVATVLDDEATLKRKYEVHCLDKLRLAGCEVHTSIDITSPESFTSVPHHSFDLVLFQFPLIPNAGDDAHAQALVSQFGVNALNRWLLRQFLLSASRFFLDPKGPRLCYITSKDVKPYCDWNIENLVVGQSSLSYQGMMAFEKERFPEYRIRNVDRDRDVRQTAGTTYVWSGDPDCEMSHFLVSSRKHADDRCSLCGAGPFLSEQDWRAHEQSKRHQRLLEFEMRWREMLSQNPSEKLAMP